MMPLADSLRNFVTNLGTEKDKHTASYFDALTLTETELLNIYQYGGVGGKVVDCVADDMIRPWRTVTVLDQDTGPFYDLESALGVRDALANLVRWSRLFGGAICVVDIDGDDPAEELREASISRAKPVTGLRVLTPQELVRVSPSMRTGRMTRYSIVDTRETFHPSRVLGPIDGVSLPIKSLYQRGGFGESVLGRCYTSLLSEAAVAAGISHVVHELKTDVIGVRGLAGMMDGGEIQSKYERRWALANELRSLVNCLLIDADTETFEAKDSSSALTGAAPLLERFANRIASETDIPMTRLFGQLASGLSTSGATNQQDYYDMLSAKRTTLISPLLTKLDRLMCRSCYGAVPDTFAYEWCSFRELSEIEAADRNLKDAQTADVYLRTGVLVPGIVARDLADKGPYEIPAEYVDYLAKRDGLEGGEPEEERAIGIEAAETLTGEVGETGAPVTGEVQKTALNGAQVTSLLEIAAKAKTGELEREQAIGIILVAFPMVTQAEAERIVTVREMFVPVTPAPIAPTPAAAPQET